MSFTPASLRKQTVPELRALCTERGVSSFGRKDELIARISEGEAKAPTPKRTPRASTKKPAPASTPIGATPKVSDLKEWLKEHGLSTVGLKAELLSRYEEAKEKLSGAFGANPAAEELEAVSYTHLRAHETPEHLVCRLLLEKKKKNHIKARKWRGS
eukprot:TRINITY_DN61416_c0_g1_i1.p1 TRINITY_DN61416_c0_g1~~TRINITY_DN61416_c0_g1_i1.p1  ORF type:complete len:157 (-),score=39.43 TRINITY_DN61416_c0_g1_i1:50-520(-)